MGNFKALIVDSDSAARIHLRQALKSVANIERIDHARSEGELQHRLEKEHAQFDVVFLSGNLDVNLTAPIIQSSKQAKLSAGTAFILLVNSDADSADIAGKLALGIDGFLKKPYSVEGLREVMSLAEDVKKKSRAERIRTALRLLVLELRDHLSHLSRLKKAGHVARTSDLIFKEMTSVIQDFDSDMLQMYFEILLEEFPKERSLAKTPLSTQSYRGSSPKLRKRRAEKTLYQVRTLLSKTEAA